MPFDAAPEVRQLDELGTKLMEAAELIEKHGWQQGTYGDPIQGFCLLGAVRFAHGYRASDCTKLGIPWEYGIAKRCGFEGGHDVPIWNDKPGRTKQEVADRLRAAAMRKPE